MIFLNEARDLIAGNVASLRAKKVGLDKAWGRILREDVHAPEDVPPFDRSAMDGYAVGGGDNSKKFRVIGEVRTGKGSHLRIKRGECARIFTGTPIPAGASQVLMQESVRVENGWVFPRERSRVKFVRQRGEDARRGDLLLRAGTNLGAGELAVLAGVGLTRPLVSPLVRVAHFVTGDELIDPSQKLKPGQIRDSNSILVTALIQQWGGEIVRQERVRDDFDLLLKKVRAVKNGFDLLLVSGGASVGDYDFGARLLKALGFKIHFEKIRLRPGKPLIFATRGKQAAFVLPGNPVSHLVTLQSAVRLAVERFSGGNISWSLVEIKLAEHFEVKADARETFWPARVEIEKGELVVRPLRWQSSGDVTGLAAVNALLKLGGNSPAPKVGRRVPVRLLHFS